MFHDEGSNFGKATGKETGTKVEQDNFLKLKQFLRGLEPAASPLLLLAG